MNNLKRNEKVSIEHKRMVDVLYYQKNRNRIREYLKNWKKNHPEKNKEYYLKKKLKGSLDKNVFYQ